MRFRFNGDADCPDWILAEIYTLSRLSSIKLKLLGQIVCQGIITPPIQIDKVNKLFAESKTDADINITSCISCLSFLLSSATRFNCDSTALQSELQQLGLPREHSTSIRKVFDEYNVCLVETFKAQSLKIQPLEDVSTAIDPEVGCTRIDLKIQGQKRSVVISQNTLDSLLDDLSHIKKVMSELKGS
ncbi:COMM domain-containing protein 4 [Euwallacea similis]|uniref:COMM domain-containing protein 4 n=1 Tax=Euwallacea similis TaxID=1736056 RepID=UPI00344DC6A3